MAKEKFNIDTILAHRSDELNIGLGVSLGHSVSQGDLSEEQWIRFLRSFLPHRYDVSKGFVFDSKGGVSEQIDIIVFDRFHSPLIYETDNGEKYVTAESVYAVFEVKQEANKGFVEYADKKIQSVLDLHRTRRGIVVAGEARPPRELTHIIGGLLTTNSVKSGTLCGHIERSANIDMACSALTGTFHKGADGKVTHSDSGEAVFAFFFLLLNELYKLGTVGAIDIQEYADRSLKSFSLERGEV